MRKKLRHPLNGGVSADNLIVEDDLTLRQLYRVTLTTAGFSVREVGDGYDALHVIDVERPDLVVLGLALPRLDDRSVREELAAKAQTRDIPVVVVTGSTGPEIYQLDADCALTKPVIRTSWWRLCGGVSRRARRRHENRSHRVSAERTASPV